MMNINLAIYIAVMAVVTYIIRATPILIFRKKIESVYVKSFLFYVPYAVLGAMTLPAVLYSTGSVFSAIFGTLVAFLLAYFNKSLIVVALSASAAAYVAEWILVLLK